MSSSSLQLVIWSTRLSVTVYFWWLVAVSATVCHATSLHLQCVMSSVNASKLTSHFMFFYLLMQFFLLFNTVHSGWAVLSHYTTLNYINVVSGCLCWRHTVEQMHVCNIFRSFSEWFADSTAVFGRVDRQASASSADDTSVGVCETSVDTGIADGLPRFTGINVTYQQHFSCKSVSVCVLCWFMFFLIWLSWSIWTSGW